jgi:hypothetical protein
MTRDLEKAGSDFEKMIRKELGGSSPIPWRVEDIQKNQTAVSSVSDFLVAGLVGGLSTRGWLVYNLPSSNPSKLHVGVVQPGINSFPATLLYTAELSRSLLGNATFAQSRPETGIFQGDPTLCERLNSNKEIVRLAASLYRGKVKVARLVVEISPYLEVSGDGTTSQLMVRKVLLLKGIGTLLFQVKEFLQLLSLIEALP